VTKQVLLKAFDHVDLVENCEAFVDQAKDVYLKDEIESGRVGEVRCQGLQNVHFEGTSWEGRYDVIWCQWVLGHLTEGRFDCEDSEEPKVKQQWLLRLSSPSLFFFYKILVS